MKRFAWFFILFLTFAGFAFAPKAQAIDPSSELKTFIEAVDKCTIGDCTNKQWYWTDSLNESSQYVIGSILGGSDNPQSVFYHKKSAVASVSNVILAMYTTPPADIAIWFQDTGRSLGFLPKQANAQGIGFTGLSPLLGIWKAFRNISYAILAVIMVVIGFMVMFRQKIDPKTVVTVQNALPKIVLALLLITFSYAIAAFMIDLMYLVMAIVINLIVSSNPGAFTNAFGPTAATTLMSGGLGTVMKALFGGGYGSIDDLVKLLFYWADANQNPVWWFIQKIGTVMIPAQSVLVWLIVSIAIIFGIVRIAFMLISAYIQIIVAVLVAPFQLMLEALPGSTSFSAWMKNMVANLSVFPITAAMILIGTLLTRENAGKMWVPPMLSGTGDGVSGLIGLGILMTIPSVAGSIKEALKAKAPVEAGLGAILGPVGGGIGQVMQLGYQASFISSAFRHQPGGRGEPTEIETLMAAQTKGIKPGK